MRENRTVILFLIMLLISSAAPLFAGGGGGGSYWGVQTTHFPFLENVEVRNNSLELHMAGGYGFGIDRNGRIYGGFGYGIFDPENEEGVSGGFGGFIQGKQILSWPVHLAVVSYTGFGGIGWKNWEGREEAAYFAFSEEITLEAGLNLGGWFIPTVYVGYQWIFNVLPGESFSAFQSFTPTMGFRLGFGNV